MKRKHSKRDVEILIYTILGAAALIGFAVFVWYIYGGNYGQ